MLFANGFEALRRFELIRRHLGHAAVLTDGELAELRGLAGDSPFPAVGGADEHFLVAYQERLAAALARAHNPSLPEPVLPDVDPTTGHVRHGTCTSNTMFVIDVRAGTLLMQRPGEAIDPDDGFRTALAVLAGFLAGWDREAEAPEGVIDPRVSARPGLVGLLGEADADQMLADYVPHWGAWALEQKVAQVEAVLRPLREERARLIGRRLDIPPDAPLPSPSDELTDWECELSV